MDIGIFVKLKDLIKSEPTFDETRLKRLSVSKGAK
jgi:hypothetical protein